MLSISEYHEILKLVLDMTEVGYISPADRDRALHQASLAKFREMLPSYGLSGISREALSPFLEHEPIEADENGIFEITGCERLWLVRVARIEKGDQVVSVSARGPFAFDEISARMRSQLREVTQMYPIIEDRGSRNTIEGVRIARFKIHPNGGEVAGEAAYVRLPTRPKYNYTEQDGEETFVAEGSTAPEWSELYAGNIVLDAVRLLGIPLDNALLTQARAVMAQAGV